MEDEYVDAQDSSMNEVVNRSEGNDSISDASKDFGEVNFDDSYEDDDGGNSFRGGRGRGNFRGRGRGPPPGWMNGPPPMRFRGRGYGPGGPPMRGRGFFRGRGGPRYGPNNGPNFDNNWGPMGPPPPGMMGGPPPFGPPPGMMGPGGPMGPPPNMMGQPPFGGPPGMPPPNMPAPELWVETKSEEGKSYYYHARTRETTWTRPQESPTCKVITQGEMEAMAAAGQMPGMGGPQSMPMNGPMGMGMGPGMMGGMGLQGGPGGPAPGAAPTLPPFMTQPPPWVKDGGNKDKPTEADSPIESDDAPPGETEPRPQPNGTSHFPAHTSAPPGFAAAAAAYSSPPAAFPGAPPGFPHPPGLNAPPGGFPGAPGGPPGGFPGGPGGAPGGFPPGAGGFPPGQGAGGPGGPGAWGGWGGWPPPLHGSAGATSQPGEPEPAAEPPPVQAPKKEETVIPAALAAAAAEWSAHRAPDGRPYYYHAERQESVWEKPKPMRELEELQAKIAEEKGEKPEKKDKMDVDSKVEVIDVEAHAEAVAAAEAAEREKQQEIEREKERAKEREEKERQEQEKEKEKAEKEKAKQRKNKPISIMPISGTPWCLVWSGDGRVFFYNPTAHTSVWERPDQLIGRADVDRAVSCPPPAVTQYFQRKEATAPAAAKPANGELKRTADSDSEDSDSEPAKKAKTDDAVAAAKKAASNSSLIDAGKEARVEAEARAARQRALVPLDQRIRIFRQMLAERDVSAFSTWEKELKKIVCDCRYLLLTSEERKQVYNKYVRERAEEERKEKKNKLQQKKNAFKQLMEEAKLHSKSSFSDFSTKHGRDDRFKGIDKPRDRVTFFNEHIAELRKREKEEKEKKREQAKTDFIALLKEKSVDRHARWADAKKKVDSEARYKAVESSTLREDYFREYCKIVKVERKKDKDSSKDKERDRSSSKKEKKDKDRDKEKEKEKDSKKDKKKEKGSEEQPAEPSEAEEAEESSGDSPSRSREARAAASIKEREREVQRALATSLRDRDKEREQHKRDEAVQHFNALLADLVRNPDLSWREAKKQLKKDHRYNLAELLSKEDKERLFVQHTSNLASRRRDKLRTLLTDMGVSPTAHWRDVRDKLTDAPTYTQPDKMEREFREFQRDRQSAAKTALRQLLQETRAITHKTRAALRDNALAVHDYIKHDARYLALEHIPEERGEIIASYLEEIEKKGPPPPPTATEPCRRAKQ